MDILNIINLGFTTVFTNFVVFGVTASLLLLLGGTIFIVINGKQAKIFILDGLIVGGIVALLSGIQLHVIPTSFSAVRELGIPTFPESDFTQFIDTALYWLALIPSNLSLILIGAGFTLMIFKVRDWGGKMMLSGICMSLIVVFVTNGNIFGIITLLFNIPAQVL
jgi:hypothetical protein